MSAPAAVLEARNVSKSYGAVRALRDVTLELRAGEVLGLVGDNGAGKTTLVKCISGTHRPDGGEIHVDGEHQPALTPEGARVHTLAGAGDDVVRLSIGLEDAADIVADLEQALAAEWTGTQTRWLQVIRS